MWANMKNTAIIMSVFLLAWAVTSDGQAAKPEAKSKESLSVAGLRIVKPGYKDGDQELRPFNWNAGTTLALRLDRPAGGIIDIDVDASKIDYFRDDKGTDLLASPKGPKSFVMTGLSSWPNISSDGKVCMMELNGGSTPKQGAAKIEAKGVMQVTVASEKQTLKQKSVALKKGTKLELAGPIAFTITDVGEGGWQDAAMQVTLEADQAFTAVAEVKFYGPDGKLIESSDIGGSKMSFNNQIKESRNYAIKQKVDTATIEIVIWKDMQRVRVPFDLSVGVGL